MKSISTSLICCFLFFVSSAQTAAKSVYAELGGPGIFSANYDMRLMKKEDGLGFRVGIGGFSIKQNYNNGNNTPAYDKATVLFIPLEINYLLGKDSRHYFEIGGGATIVSASSKTVDINFSDNEKFNSTFGHLYFGYRLQPKEGGFLFRAGITPVFGKGYFLPYLPGISFGYKF